uniref:Deleted in malignant brain tumors 1 protein-like n=1 Tax=Acanthochromis polyacanthus TaxID=80966 RepID=A0A3Q1EFK3_9TELE
CTWEAAPAPALVNAMATVAMTTNLSAKSNKSTTSAGSASLCGCRIHSYQVSPHFCIYLCLFNSKAFFCCLFQQPTATPQLTGHTQLTGKPQVGSSVCRISCLQLWFIVMICSPPSGNPCGGYLFGSGTFSSPNHPDHYNDHSYCVWQLRASHDQRIYITFDFVELENCCSCDYVSVYDGSSVYSGLLGKVCNGNVASFFSSSTYMTVLFRTDSSVVARGFRAEFMSRVECSSENMNIVISRSYLSSLGYTGNDLYLNDPNCRPYYNSNYEIDNGTVIYTNNVGASNSSSSSSEITRQSHFELNVNCRMDKDSVSQTVYIVNHPGSSSIIGSGKFNTSMDFYTSSSFYDKVTQRPYSVSLNEYMYVQVDLWRPDGSLVIFIDTCVTSPSADDFYSKPYYLVRDGCSADSTYYAYISGTRSYARFRFKSFQFLRASKAVYIQCTVLICPASDYNSRCRRGCMRRTARDLGSDHESQTLVLGPIQLKAFHFFSFLSHYLIKSIIKRQSVFFIMLHSLNQQ